MFNTPNIAINHRASGTGLKIASGFSLVIADVMLMGKNSTCLDIC